MFFQDKDSNEGPVNASHSRNQRRWAGRRCWAKDLEAEPLTGSWLLAIHPLFGVSALASGELRATSESRPRRSGSPAQTAASSFGGLRVLYPDLGRTLPEGRGLAAGRLGAAVVGLRDGPGQERSHN